MARETIFTTRFSNEFLALCGMGLGLTAIIGTVLVIIVVVMVIVRRKTLRDEMEATIKIEMIERGMSADDIERVLKARMAAPEFALRGSPFNKRFSSRGQPVGPPAKST
jgi:hypothetical protein